MSITGERDGPPVKPGPTIGDTGTGMLMAFSIVSALFDRARSGKGRRLQVAMQDSVMHYSRGGFITQARTGKAAPRRPPANNPPGGIYPCRPGGPNDYVYLLTSRANPEHWPRLLKLIGYEDLIGDERYATPDARLQREAEVVPRSSPAGPRSAPSKEAMAQLSAVGVPAGAVLDDLDEPSFYERGILKKMTHGERKMVIPPGRCGSTACRPRSSRPLLGEQTRRGAVRLARPRRRRRRTAEARTASSDATGDGEHGDRRRGVADGGRGLGSSVGRPAKGAPVARTAPGSGGDPAGIARARRQAGARSRLRRRAACAVARRARLRCRGDRREPGRPRRGARDGRGTRPAGEPAPGSRRRLAVPAAGFDYVLSWNVIHHGTLGDLGRRLGEIWRVLRPAGLLQATVLSTRDANYGIGRAIAPDTFVIDRGRAKRPPALLLRSRDARRSACRL